MLNFIIREYLTVMILIGFVSMGVDKFKAKLGSYRISENTLLLIAILGGSIGSIIGMFVFRHKTLHLKFFIGLPLILIIQLFIVSKFIK